MTRSGVERWFDYRHLSGDDRRPPDVGGVFFDPADTEVGVWAAVDLVEPGAAVLDLGSGSGAAAAAVARAGAGQVHGLDVSPASVDWASGHYRSENGSTPVTFGWGDYTLLTPDVLVGATPFGRRPDVVMSNPPYVPVPAPPPGTTRVSIDGGTDGLRLVRVVVGHAAALGSALALTIGSYTSVRRAASLLAEHGFGISSITLSALRLGDYTVQHGDRVFDLERRGEGPLLRTADGAVHYLVVGLSCRRPAIAGGAGPVSPDDLLELLRLACRSATVALETCDEPGFTFPVPVRVLVLPDEPGRLHC
jgi:SAM-dependent methyltransferase